MGAAGSRCWRQREREKDDDARRVLSDAERENDDASKRLSQRFKIQVVNGLVWFAVEDWALGKRGQRCGVEANVYCGSGLA